MKSISEKLYLPCCELSNDAMLKIAFGLVISAGTVCALSYYIDKGETLSNLAVSVEESVVNYGSDPLIAGLVLCVILSGAALWHTQQVAKERNLAANMCLAELLKQSQQQGGNVFSEDELCETACLYVGLSPQDFRTDILQLLKKQLASSGKFTCEKNEAEGKDYWTYKV